MDGLGLRTFDAATFENTLDEQNHHSYLAVGHINSPRHLVLPRQIQSSHEKPGPFLDDPAASHYRGYPALL